MTTISEKTNILRKEFLEIDVNHDEYITRDELYEYLDRKVIFNKYNTKKSNK